MTSPHIEDSPQGSRPAAVANLVVRLMSEYTGRGATQARAYLQDDLVTVLLAETLTKGERTLANEGYAEKVLSMRKAYQHTMREDLVSGVEEIMGRKVIAFMSDNHLDPDFAAEVFVLAKDGGRRGDAESAASQ